MPYEDDTRPPDPRPGEFGVLGLPRVVLLLLVIDLSLSAAFVADRILGVSHGNPLGDLDSFGSPWGLVSQQLDMDGEFNVPAWYSTVKLFLVGHLLSNFAVAAWGLASALGRVVLVAAPLVFFFLSYDEATMFHEKVLFYVEQRFDPSGSLGGGLWEALLMLSAALVVFILLGRAAWPWVRGKPRVWRRFLAGVVLFVVSAGVFDHLKALAPEDLYWVPIATAIEECGELIAATILVWASLELLAAHRVGVVPSPRREPALAGMADTW